MSTEMTQMQEMAEMAKGLQQSASQAADDAGFLKFTKFGQWVFGTEAAEVEEDSLWIIHPQGFKHGHIAWGDKAHGNQGEKLGEIMVPATAPLPLVTTLDSVNGNWAQQVSMQLMCINGFDKGVKLSFNSNSVGGRKAYKKIVNAVIGRITAKSPDVAPVVSLASDSYKHKDYGQIFTPMIHIDSYKSLGDLDKLMNTLGLEDQTGDAEPDPEPEVKEEVKTEEEPKRARRTRRSR